MIDWYTICPSNDIVQLEVGCISMARPLPNKPLVEAIFEFRWQIVSEEGDTHYPLFVGRLYDRVQTQYRFHEPLPTSLIPLPAAGNIVQHRFRAERDRWPLVQVGPGIVTINDTEGYIWPDFGGRAKTLVKAIYEAYPEPSQLRVAGLILRYLDAFELDDDQDMLDYLSGKLKSKMIFPHQLFEGTAVSPHPRTLNITAAFPGQKPRGTIIIGFRSGKHNDKPALIMETAMRSDGSELPGMPQGFEEWIEEAHGLTDDWFFKLIEGELEREFSGE